MGIRTQRATALAALVVGVFCLVGCGARRDGLAMSLDVQQLPPAAEPAPGDATPPLEAPADSVPPAAQTPPPPPPRPTAADRLKELNAALPVVYFSRESWEITPEGASAISGVAGTLQRAGDFGATVEGHADETGPDEYNKVLGLYRAKAVKDRLRDLGVDPSRLTLVTHGKARPATRGDDPDALARNRRVEIVIRVLR